MFKRILVATFWMALISAIAVTSAVHSEAEPSGLRRPDVHIDCLDHNQPRLCTRVVDELLADLGRFNDAFNPPNLDRLAKFFHEDPLVFSNGRLFDGRHEIRTELLTPLVAASGLL